MIETRRARKGPGPAGPRALSRFRQSASYRAHDRRDAIAADLAEIRELSLARAAVERRRARQVTTAVVVFAATAWTAAVVFFFGPFEVGPSVPDDLRLTLFGLATLGTVVVSLFLWSGGRLGFVRPEPLHVKRRRLELIDRLVRGGLPEVDPDRAITVRAGLRMDDHDPERVVVRPATSMPPPRPPKPHEETWLRLELPLRDGCTLRIDAHERTLKTVFPSFNNPFQPRRWNRPFDFPPPRVEMRVTLTLEVGLRPPPGKPAWPRDGVAEPEPALLPRGVEPVPAEARPGERVAAARTTRVWTDEALEGDGAVDAVEVIRALLATVRP